MKGGDRGNIHGQGHKGIYIPMLLHARRWDLLERAHGEALNSSYSVSLY